MECSVLQTTCCFFFHPRIKYQFNNALCWRASKNRKNYILSFGKIFRVACGFFLFFYECSSLELWSADFFVSSCFFFVLLKCNSWYSYHFERNREKKREEIMTETVVMQSAMHLEIRTVNYGIEAYILQMPRIDRV